MLLVYVLLTFCHLHSIANSKIIAANILPGTVQSYSDESLWDPADMDTQFLTAQYNKLIENASNKPLKTDTDNLEWNAKVKRTNELFLPYINEDDYPPAIKERRSSGDRDARGDSFMRFGRSRNDDYMRFGRSLHDDFMRLGRAPHDGYMRFGRSAAADDYMRFGRSPHDNYMRFGRDAGSDFLRFGKADNKQIKQTDLLRSMKNLNGVDEDDISSILKRFYAGPDNFMRFGRTFKSTEKDLAPDFMRFGRSVNSAKSIKTHDKTPKNQQH